MHMIGTVLPADVERISGKVFMTAGDKSRNLSAFWVLLTLSAVIATAGVITDSTATVIGAMIVAPLMTPILGAALSVVLARKRALWRSLSLVVGGAMVVIAIGFVFGLVTPLEAVAETNPQIEGRVSPALIDLIAALATGFVGAFALLRAEVSDTLPGVAIAISLVPPLVVVGLTAESGAWVESFGALLLFATNVAAIIATGTLLMLLAGVRNVARESGVATGDLRGRTLALVAGAVAVVALPLAAHSVYLVVQHFYEIEIQQVAEDWADAEGWVVTEVAIENGLLDPVVTIEAIGRPPEADEQTLRERLDSEGFEFAKVELTLILGGQVDLPASSGAD